MMIVEKFAFRHVIDDNRSATIANFVADCRFDVEFPAGQQPESNFVTNGAGNPTILRYLALLRRIPSQLCGKLLPGKRPVSERDWNSLTQSGGPHAEGTNQEAPFFLRPLR